MDGWETVELVTGLVFLGCAATYAFGPERWFVRGRRGPVRPLRLGLAGLLTLLGALQVLNSLT